MQEIDKTGSPERYLHPEIKTTNKYYYNFINCLSKALEKALHYSPIAAQLIWKVVNGHLDEIKTIAYLGNDRKYRVVIRSNNA